MRDSDIRKALIAQLAAHYVADSDTRIVEEMGIWSGSVRIDVAVINGELSGFELKSDRDTLNRLPFQVKLYSQVFDRLTLVVGSRHLKKAKTHIPRWWGITVATEIPSGIVLQQMREGSKNPAPDPYLVAQLLWKEEAIAALDAYGLSRGWRSKRIKLIHQRLAKEIPFDELSAIVRLTLKTRKQWLRQMVPRHLDVPVDANSNPMFQT